MADISKIQTPNGTQYDLKDVVAREAIPFGIVDDTSTSTVFTATVPGIFDLRDGTCVLLKNGVVTSAANFTININDLGAKPVYNNMAEATRQTTLFNKDYTMLFIYDSSRVQGGAWILYRGYDSNTNTIGYSLRTNYSTLPVSSYTARYRLLFTSSDKTKYVPANNSSSTNATAKKDVNQEKIDPFGNIKYYYSTTTLQQGSNPSVAVLWDQYNIALGYSFNNTGVALTLTPYLPVYLKCSLQNDGSAIMDQGEPIVQILPSLEDNYIYIHLGVASSATQIELVMNHPVYQYKNGKIQHVSPQIDDNYWQYNSTNDCIELIFPD